MGSTFGILLSLFLCLAKAETPMTMAVPDNVANIPVVAEYQDFLKAAMKDAGYELTFVYLPNQRAFEKVVRGDVDALMYDDAVRTKNRSKLVSLSFSVAKVRMSYFYRKENPIEKSELKKYKGAIVLHNAAVEKIAKEMGLNFSTNQTTNSNVQMLLSKRIDYFIAVERVGLQLINSFPGAKDLLALSPEPFGYVDVALTFNIRHKAEIPKIENAVRKKLKGDLSPYPQLKGLLNSNPIP